jgi:hypothetical protein
VLNGDENAKYEFSHAGSRSLPQSINSHDLHILLIWYLACHTGETLESVHPFILARLSSDLGDTGVGEEKVEVALIFQHSGHKGRDGFARSSISLDGCELCNELVPWRQITGQTLVEG